MISVTAFVKCFCPGALTQLGAIACDDERSRVRHRRVARRHIEDLQRLLPDDTVRHVDVRAVVSERGVERRKRLGFRIGELPEVAADDIRLLGRGGGERSEAEARGESGSARQLGRIPAVHDHHAEGRIGIEKRLERVLVQARWPREAELGRGDRRDVGEAPLLVANRRESQLDEPGGGVVAQILQPARAPARTLLERREPGL
jgi:hypothetical protein